MTHSHLVITNALNVLYICHVLFVHSLSLFPGGEACPEMCQSLVALSLFFTLISVVCVTAYFLIAVLIFPFE